MISVGGRASVSPAVVFLVVWMAFSSSSLRVSPSEERDTGIAARFQVGGIGVVTVGIGAYTVQRWICVVGLATGDQRGAWRTMRGFVACSF